MNYRALCSVKTFTILFLLTFSMVFHSVNGQQRPTPTRRTPTQQPTPNQNQIEEEQQQKEDSIQYGPNTTHYTFERNIKYNQEEYYSIDTLIDEVYNYSVVEKHNNMLQDLGNIGTATHPVFFTFPTTIGARSGFEAYTPYFIAPDDIQYYDTQSPHTKLELNFGGEGRSIAGVTFSANISPDWNVGAKYVRGRADKQLGSDQSQGDTHSTSDAITVFTHYRTQNKKYQILANFSILNHDVEESGGIVIEEDDELGDLFRYQDALVWLGGAYSRERRNNIHVYHQYEVSKLLQVYHSLDRTGQTNTFEYPDLNAADTVFFKRILFSTDSTFDETHYSVIQNEAGIKGDLGPIFYSFYHKFRTPRFSYNHFDGKYSSFEQYLGFNIRYDLNEKISLKGDGEYNSADIHRIRGVFETPLVDASYQRARSIPSYLERTYWGNHNFWYDNDFEPTAADQISGTLKLNFSSLSLRPFLSITNVHRPVYFVRDTIPDSRQAFPIQETGSAQILSPGVDISLDFLKYLRLRSKVIYTTVTGKAANALDIPSLFINAKLCYNRVFMNGKIIMETGIDTHFRTAYYAYDYDVATQQFFVQNEFEVPAYFLVDYYFALKVRRARVYVKVPQINQGLGQYDGYFVTPIYSGQQRTFDIGISWPFFD